MKLISKVLLKLFYATLTAVFLLNFTACNKKDNTVSVEEDNTVYVELNSLADGFGNKDGIAQNDEIAKVNDLFNTNDKIWGFLGLELLYSSSTYASIPADTMSSWLKKPEYYFAGPYTTEQISHAMYELSSVKWGVFLAFVIQQKNNKYYVSQCFKAFPKSDSPMIELKIF